MYIECGENTANVLQCPAGQYYNKDIKQCNKDTNSLCKGQESAQEMGESFNCPI